VDVVKELGPVLSIRCITLKKFLQHTKARRQAAREFCEEMSIPLNDAMAMLDTDYASEPQTCGEDTDVSEDTADRRAKADLGPRAMKLVGLEWRNPDMSERQTNLGLGTYLIV